MFRVTVIAALPFFRALTLPWLLTVATAGLSLVKLVAFIVEGIARTLILKVFFCFRVIFFAFNAQPAFTVTVAFAVAPLAVVTVTVAFPFFYEDAI